MSVTRHPEALQWFQEVARTSCFYCGISTRKADHLQGTHCPHKRTVDHVVPKAKEGLDVLQNKVICCWACNQSKSTLSLEDFRDLVAQREGEVASTFLFAGEKAYYSYYLQSFIAVPEDGETNASY